MFRSYHVRAPLLFYIYTVAYQSTQTGVLTMHPLYYEYPEEEEAYTSWQP
jgi:alpha-glucosidase (family GH31 glycosyl hydrolase)